MPWDAFSANATLNAWLRNDGFTPPESLYVGLLKNGVEISGENYARQEVEFSPPSSQRCGNAHVIEFPLATGDIETQVNQVGIFTAETGGQRIFWGSLTTSFNYLENVQPIIPVNALGVRLNVTT